MRSSITKHQPSLSNSLIFTIPKFQVMKKTYISPEMLTVHLGTCKMMAESFDIGTGEGDPEIGDSGDILTKESKNIWDEEW